MDGVAVPIFDTFLFRVFMVLIVFPVSMFALYKTRDFWKSPNACIFTGAVLLASSYLVELRSTESTFNTYYLVLGSLFAMIGVFMKAVRFMAINDYKRKMGE